MDSVDSDIASMTQAQLIAEVKKLRAGIRQHRDCSGHELCWYQPDLWSLLPEKADPPQQVPEWPQFLRGCIKYRQSLDAQLAGAARTDQEFGD
jgi:hypothetical protein